MWVAAVAGLPLGLLGLSAYLGYAKPIVAIGFPGPYLCFGGAWFGLSGVVMALAVALSSAGMEILGLLLGLVAFGCFALMLLSFFWLPRRLQPAWYRGWADRGKRIEEAREWPAWGRGDRRA
jgi:hypothetical protein